MKEVIDEAVRVLRGGGVILYPTDTVWGLGCDATNSEAVRKVFEIKHRSEAKSLVLLAADLDRPFHAAPHPRDAELFGRVAVLVEALAADHIRDAVLPPSLEL